MARMKSTNLQPMDCTTENRFPATERTCRTSFESKRSAMAKIVPWTGRGYYDIAHDFCMHPNSYCVPSPCDKPSIAPDVLVPLPLEVILALSRDILADSQPDLAADK